MKKGFTLIELLAVILILGVISTIVVISVSDTISKSKDKTYEVVQAEVLKAAEAYYLNEGDGEKSNCVTVKSLIDGGYFEKTTVIDPRTGEELKGSVTITRNDNQYEYKYQTSDCN